MKAEWANLAGDTTPGSLDDLYAIGDELDALRRKPKRDRVDERRLRDIALLLVKASQAPPEDEGEAMLQRELIASYRSQVGNLSKAANKLALALGAGELDLNVLQVEKAVYREDIKQLGVWGGLLRRPRRPRPSCSSRARSSWSTPTATIRPSIASGATTR